MPISQFGFFAVLCRCRFIYIFLFTSNSAVFRNTREVAVIAGNNFHVLAGTCGLWVSNHDYKPLAASVSKNEVALSKKKKKHTLT